MVQVTVSCPVYPSEDPGKVVKALRNIFPTGEFAVESGAVSGAADLDEFARLIRRQRILDTARSQMLKGRKHSRTRTAFELNKQVATVGKVSFVDYDVALGTISVEVRDDDIDELIDRVAPVTVDGEEVRA
ncbi:RNA-binding domain-containing protein [Methanomassiliicoccaceae archaeon COG_1]|nr:RNA-binding domain-containing protein [Methanomassiliicoccaceae archaeon COG_1]